MKRYKKIRPRKEGFVFVGYREDFDAKQMIAVRIISKPVAVFKRENGSFFAREMSCKHQGADLTTSPINGKLVTCSRHGWQYDVETGACTNRDSPKLREHEVVIENNAVFVGFYPR